MDMLAPGEGAIVSYLTQEPQALRHEGGTGQ